MYVQCCSSAWAWGDTSGNSWIIIPSLGGGTGEDNAVAYGPVRTEREVKICSTVQPGRMALPGSLVKITHRDSAVTLGFLELGIQRIQPANPNWKWDPCSLLKWFELLQKWFAPKHSSSWHPDWQCWAGCSKGNSLTHVMPLILHGVSGLLWPPSELKQETAIAQRSWKLSWTGPKVKILDYYQERRKKRWHVLRMPHYIINSQKMKSNMLYCKSTSKMESYLMESYMARRYGGTR